MFTKVESSGDAQGLRSARIATTPGHAVANSLAAIRAGVRQDRVHDYGIGERAGNASLKKWWWRWRCARTALGYDGIRLEQLFPTSRLLTESPGRRWRRTRAIGGRECVCA